ncbi:MULTISPECIES: ATP-dependent Clp protease ATP-binding subunit [Caproicibacterium]|uniref:ATP-dependent Clp protease ATP-binding subunit n=1 Tax=Caproicibacterium argilliputei TaxID=3030016 RepID=A0AA97H0L5_9FIRM|nr:ATP-dependent Clp protease ATP-binding subunit [Caproicibacterium argilliputei]WOC31666.1 ATP-dependent Clp protease ATP-binding subunit [Caproicibacterium argilliputei]
MLCSRCHKRPAVVFLSTSADSNDTQGLCLTCARELGIKPVNDLMDKMGLTDEQMEAMEEELGEFMNPEETGEDGSGDSEDGFVPGGAALFPANLLRNLYGGRENKSENSPEPRSQPKADKKKAEKAKSKRKHLNAYCTDLTAKARAGQIDRIVGREKEISRVIQILSRRTKNNPCLIGEPGVGKTAVAEGLALRIAEGTVPMHLQKKEIHLLDLTALVAGTQFRGQFESRIKGLVEEVKQEGNIILFIDEVHNLVGTGDAEGSMNAANILKPALSRGEIQVIGATTFTEYRKYIEKDAALERRFQPVTIAEPSVADADEILRGIKEYYENFHRVRVSDQIAHRTVVLAERYINDRFLPDKAIDLLDEACACAALRNTSMNEYDRLTGELEHLHREEEDMTADGETTNYEELARVRTDISRLQQRAETLAPAALGAPVEEQDLAHVIELWTGIPASRVQESELKKLSHIEDTLNQHIIGQKEAVAAVAAAIRRSRVQISPRRRPASFIFVGPTGVGKTELVKVLSKELFDKPETLIRLDMSEFMEKHSVSRIIGSPPGYVGYDEAGQVTEKVRRQPYSVLLFDEIEKAHPDVMNILLQILDEGHITDAQGRNVNFENTILVMTSNAGSTNRESALGFNRSEQDVSKEHALKALSEFLRPEFLSRVDETIVFRNLSVEDFEDIARLMLNEYVDSLKERGILFTYDDAAVHWLAKSAYGGKSGARDLRTLIRRKVEDRLAEIIIETTDTGLTGVSLTVSGEELSLCTLA